MRVATRYFVLLGVFAFLAGVVYWFITYESVGTVLFLAFACTPAIIAWFAIRHGSMRDRRPEDDADADPAERAGEVLGPFPAETVWPIFLVLGSITIGASLIYGLILVPLGAALFVWALLGFTRESRG
ncbi:MAG TPA: cytochrome c oxidase subunit 4 [Actinomycetota bacterium]|nr:cytochrome c oxidase subunit 4 [Actinomycetota bacterium]